MGDEQSFGRQLKTYRARLGVTQEQLAEIVGLSVETIKRYEGNRLMPSDATARRLAEKLEISTDTTEFVAFMRLARPPLPSNPLSSRAQSRVRRTRDRMLARVHDFWIKDVLEKSLDGTGLIHLTLEYRPSSVAYRWDGVLKAPDETTQPLAPSQTIVDVFDSQDGKLLILGPPGSGKTTMLLDLARSLLTRAEQQESSPIPVVFNLSSWADRRLSLADWLADELSVRYDVPRKIGAEWIVGDKLLLLLDGLDEVDRQYRMACIDAINTFQTDHEVDLVVCSRLADYEELSTKLRLRGAVVLQPLAYQQVAAFLNQAGQRLASLRAALERDTGLRELAESPLMLSIMAQAYRDTAPAALPLAETVEAQRQHVFQRYFERTLARRGDDDRYTPQQTRRWLIWLAHQMKQRSQSVFFLEQMQPDWLMSSRAQWHYALLDRLSGALLVGLVVAFGFGCAIVGYGLLRGLPDSYLHRFGENMLVMALLGAVVGGLFGGFDESAAYRPANRLRWAGGILLDWISGGLFLGLIARLVVAAPGSAMIFAMVGCAIGALAKRPTIRPRHINIVETLRWSWARTRRLMPTCITGGAIVGLLTGIFVGTLDGLLGKVFSALAGSLIAGSLIGLLMSLVFGITHTELNELTVFPNQGIWRSARNAAWAGVEGALIGGTLGALVASGPISWLLIAFLGAIISALAFGYYAFLSHFALRFVLWRNGVVPWRYTQFLDYAVDRILLRKVGGGYMFVHGLLQDHLATSESDTSSDGLDASSPPQSSSSFQAVMPAWIDTVALMAILVVIALGAYIAQIAIPAPTNLGTAFELVIDTSKAYTGTATYMRQIEPGDLVSVQAQGALRLGPFTDSVDPEGTERDSLGFPLGDAYKVVSDFPDGALLCKISSEHEWRKCGVGLIFRAESRGSLEFLVNDGGLDVHNGRFGINVVVQH